MSDQLNKSPRGHRAVFHSFLAILTIASFAGCDSKKEEDAKAEAEAKAQAAMAPVIKPTLVELEDVARGPIEALLERSAPLEAESEVQVLARTQNPAVELLVEKGDKVEKGQALLRLEDDRQRTDFATSLTQLEQAKVDLSRKQNLYDQDLISETEFLTAKFSYTQAELRHENNKRQLDYTEVRAPIKGTITSRTVKVGDSVNMGTPIFQIIDLESTVAVIHVPEQYLPKLRVDMPARLISSTYDDQVFEGYVKRISPIVEARAGTIEVVVGIRKLGALRPGMWVDVELVLETKDDALLIPKRSIVYDNDQIFAFKQYTDTNGVNRAKRYLVRTVNIDKEHIEPKENFEVGDRIVVAGQIGLKDNQPIREVGQPKTIPDPAATTNTLAMAATNSAAKAEGPKPGKPKKKKKKLRY